MCNILPYKGVLFTQLRGNVTYKGVKLQPGLKPLRCNLTHSVYSVESWITG